MPFIEAPTTFYLGRRYDPDAQRISDDVVYYDSRDLTTHAIVVGMTGSGKTGLCIGLLEEAILDNIPAIVVDPKGDITNLLLNFPDLRPADFEPWVNLDDAQRAGMDVPAYAADVAHRWREGLSSWGIVPDRMRWLKYAAHYSIFTPGSEAGLPISIVASLRAPRDGWAGNEEANREEINAIVTALLALVGRSAQPVQDKEHVLIANIFEYAWMRGLDLTLEDIILQVQNPPFNKLGVFPLNDYISERDRQKLAMDLNNIVAAPSFQTWLNGEPMDIQRLLYTPQGRPRVSIFYIAHLSDAERQFIITLLLESTLGWMRTQSGTTSLRALLYIDEMFGYFPPYPRNPPTKEPILRLLKQARAFGLGLILATQNPGDLDYKGLSNAGTWFIGRLQSERDRMRVMAGLESMASVSTEMNLREVGRMIADIPPRVFLMHNVHDRGGPTMLHTRWAMSYLRGPLTRQQVQVLMADQRGQLLAQMGAASYTPPPANNANPTHNAPLGPSFGVQAEFYAMQAGRAAVAPPPPPSLPEAPPHLPEMPPGAPVLRPTEAITVGPPANPINQAARDSTIMTAANRLPAGYSDRLPPLPASTVQFFLPNRTTSQHAISDWERRTGFTAERFGGVVQAYRPVLLAQAIVRYQDRKSQVFTTRTYAYRIPDLAHAGIVHWDEFAAPPVDARQLSSEPFNAGMFGDLPPGLTDARRLSALRRELIDMLYATAKLAVPFNPALNLYGNPDGDLAEFRIRAQQAARERRDDEVDRLGQRYQAIFDRLDAQLERHMQRYAAERRELEKTRQQVLFTTGEALISLMGGRTKYTLSRASRAAVFRERSAGQKAAAELAIEQTERDVQRAQQDLQAELNAINEKWARAAVQIEEHIITPFKKDISIELFGIGWLPHWYAVINDQPVLLPAF
jgi:hypothetical protein